MQKLMQVTPCCCQKNEKYHNQLDQQIQSQFICHCLNSLVCSKNEIFFGKIAVFRPLPCYGLKILQESQLFMVFQPIFQDIKIIQIIQYQMFLMYQSYRLCCQIYIFVFRFERIQQDMNNTIIFFSEIYNIPKNNSIFRKQCYFKEIQIEIIKVIFFPLLQDYQINYVYIYITKIHKTHNNQTNQNFKDYQFYIFLLLYSRRQSIQNYFVVDYNINYQNYYGIPEPNQQIYKFYYNQF
ncbi:hypothetical protein pb186bvf_019738 [Paramecium bursaria]